MLNILKQLEGVESIAYLKSNGYSDDEMVGFAIFSNQHPHPERLLATPKKAKGDCIVTLIQRKNTTTQHTLYSLELINPGNQKTNITFYESLDEADAEFRQWIVGLYDHSRYAYFDPEQYEMALKQLSA